VTAATLLRALVHLLALLRRHLPHALAHLLALFPGSSAASARASARALLGVISCHRLRNCSRCSGGRSRVAAEALAQLLLVFGRQAT